MNPEEPFDGDDEDFDLQYANTSMVMSMSHDESVIEGEDPFYAEMAVVRADRSAEASLDTFSGSGPSLASIASSSMQPDALADKGLRGSAAKVGDRPDAKMNALALADKVTESDSDELISKCVTELAQSFMVGDGIEVVEESTSNKN